MNLLDITILVILAFYVISGMYKGSITSLLGTLGFAAAWFIAKDIYPSVAKLALSNRTLMAVLNQYLEPEKFFGSQTQALLRVQDVIAGGEASIEGVVSVIRNRIPVIADAFSWNVRHMTFANLGIETVADYLDQTIWQAIFNVGSFVVCFIALYVLSVLIVNLLDRVISFPVVRGIDWLLGGIFGLLRGLVVTILVVTLLPAMVEVVSPSMAQTLTYHPEGQFSLYSLVCQLDMFRVTTLVRSLIGG